MIELIGILIFSSLFVYSGTTHLRNSSAMMAYTTDAMGNCPLAKPLGFLGGWPTGVFLVVFGVGTALQVSSLFPYGLALFLAVVTATFHRNLKDPANFKTLALLGAALFIAQNVH